MTAARRGHQGRGPEPDRAPPPASSSAPPPAQPPSGGSPPSAARSLPAGLADVALGSLTSFAIAIDAARHLDAVSLGLWGLVFSAYLLAAVVPTQFVLSPFEAALVAHRGDEQLRTVPRTMIIASLVGLPASVFAMALAATFSHGVDAGVAGRTAAIGVVLGVTSPLQDHVRRLLHQAGWSVGAALVSLVQVLVVLVAVVALRFSGLQPIYVPPLALALSNVGSLVFGVLIARRRAGSGPAAPVQLLQATRVGSWLLGAGIADRATQFACLALLSLWIGNRGVGEYEAARVAAQPVLVFSLGVVSVYRRQIMRYAQLRNEAAVRRASRSFTLLVVGAAALYGPLVAAPWAGNPLRHLTPAAYEHRGFVLAVVLATAVAGVAMAPTAEMMGARLARSFTHQITVSSVALVGAFTVALAAGSDVFAWPIAFGLRSALLIALLRKEARQIYRGVVPPEGVDPLSALR